MESISYFCFSLPYIFLIVLAFFSFSSFIYVFILKVSRPDDFSRLPNARRVIYLVVSPIIFVIVLVVGISEYLRIKENLYWANQPRICYEVLLENGHYLQIHNYWERYSGTLYKTGDSNAIVDIISGFDIDNGYIVGEWGHSSNIFFFYDLEIRDLQMGLSEEEVVDRLAKHEANIGFPLNPIISYCEEVECKLCDE